MTQMSAIARREFALFAQNNPDLSKLTPEQRQSVAAALGVRADDLERVHAYAMQNPQPQPGTGPAEPAKMSSIDRRQMQLRR